MSHSLINKVYLKSDDIQTLVNKLVPADSPSCEVIQSLFLAAINLNIDFCLSNYLSKCSLTYLDAIVDQHRHVINTDVLTTQGCQEICKDIIRNKCSDTWAVTYMLVVFYEAHGKVRKGSDAWLFMSSYLQIIFMITSRNDKHYAKIDRLGIRVRMGLKHGSPQGEILDTLIDIHAKHHSLEGVLASLKQYEGTIKKKEKIGERYNNNLTSKIGQIRLAYEVVAEDKEFYGKNRCSSNKKEQHRVKVNKQVKRSLKADDEPLLTKSYPTKHKNDNVALAENFADDDPLALLDNDFKPSKTTAKSSELQQWSLKSNYRHARRNQFVFPTNTRQLSLLSYQMLFARVWSLFLVVSDKERQVYAVLILSLLSGRSIQDVIKQLQLKISQRKWLAYEKGEQRLHNYLLSIAIDVTANRRSHLMEHRQSKDNEFKLPLPSQLQSVIEERLVVDSSDVNKLLKDLNVQLSLPALSNQHIDNSLHTIIRNELNKPLHADIITGVDVRHSSPLYYTSISTKSLEKTYNHAIHMLTEYCDDESKSKLRSLTKQGIKSNHLKQHVGSNMPLKLNACQAFFSRLATAVESYNGKLRHDLDIRYDRYIEQFNCYSVWLWHIIIIQTGMRPAVHAPGVLNQIDFTRKLMWISDKEERNNQACGRLIPLSDFLITAIKNYLVYLAEFSAIHNTFYANHKFPFDEIKNSKQPLIMLFDRNPRKFAGINASKVRYQTREFLTHQDNWLRHQLRTMLTDKVPEYLICALYGHEHPDQEIMHPMSSLSINELKALSAHLGNVAIQLNLKQVEVTLYAQGRRT